MKKIHPFFLSVLSGLCLFAAWPVSPFTLLIFVGFVPLLLLEKRCRKRAHFFGWLYLALVIWNVGTTWWICNSTGPGGVAAILANSLLMTIPWIGFHNVKKRMGDVAGYLSLILFWLTFEYIHLNWQLSWPWLTLGNAFATHPGWVQWYSYTGTSGGSLWIMLINVLVFYSIQKKSSRTRYLAWTIVLLLAPLGLSYLLKNTFEKKETAANTESLHNIVIVQPNVDPWDEKFVPGKEVAQLKELIRLSESTLDANTAMVVWPETAIPIAIDEDSMRTHGFMTPVWDFLKQHSSLNLLTGVEGFRIFPAQNKGPYSQKMPNSDLYYDDYNSAAMLDSNQFSIYHKSKFVPGAEVLPSFLHFLDAWFEKFGGATGSYVGQDDRTVLKTYNHTYRVAPAVCYESIFGEFMTGYIRNGANIIVIITNDGWWGNTAGYRQHESYARLRAIETRRWVARCANTGISCFINPVGEVMDAQPWDKQTAIKMPVPELTGLTFFAAYGDLISKAAIVIALILVVWDLFLIIKSKWFHG